jgi:hypothetical protein
MPGDIRSMKRWKLSKTRTLEWSPAIFQAKPCAPTGWKKRRARSIEAPSIRDCLVALIRFARMMKAAAKRVETCSFGTSDEAVYLPKYLTNNRRFRAFTCGTVRDRSNQKIEQFSLVNCILDGADGRTRTGTGLLRPNGF